MTAIIDTCVIIAILNDAEPHHDWSVEKLEEYQAIGPVLISDIVFCELLVGMPGLAEVRQVILDLGLERLRSSDDALLRASVAFSKYKKTDGNKTNVLPDFLIGGDASAHAAPLITANGKDFVGYFPEITVVQP